MDFFRLGISAAMREKNGEVDGGVFFFEDMTCHDKCAKSLSFFHSQFSLPPVFK